MSSDQDDTDPLEGTSTYIYDSLEIEIKQEAIDEENSENTENLNAAEILKVTLSEPLELNSTDAMPNPNTGLMVCLHCCQEMAYELLLPHMTNVHSYRQVPYKCYNCKVVYHSRSLFMDHKPTCKPAAGVKKRALKRIMREMEADQRLNATCPICSLGLPKRDVKEHLVTVHNNLVLPVVCGVCNKTFKGKVNLRAHVRLVHNAVENSVECDLCGQTFSSLKYLASHKRNVHPKGNTRHPCVTCGKKFKSHHCLHQHRKAVHPPASAAAQCPLCRNTYKSRISLRQHLRVAHTQHHAQHQHRDKHQPRTRPETPA